MACPELRRSSFDLEAQDERESRARERLHGNLSTVEYFTFGFGSMIGVGWVVLMDDWLSRGGPGGAMLGFLIGGLLLFPIAHTYGRLVQRIRDAGAEIAYTEGVFPPLVSFAAGWTMVLSYAIVCPWEAVATGNLLARVFPALNSYQLYAIAGTPIFAPRLAVGLALTALIVFINYRGIKPSGVFQNVMTFGLLATFAIFTALGFARGDSANMQPLFPRPGTAGVLLSIFLVMQIVPYFMTGFESVAKGSEEARSGLRSAQLPEGDLRGALRRAVLLLHHHRRRHLRLPVAADRVGARPHGSGVRADVRIARDRAADSVRRVPVAAEDLQRQLRRGDADAVRDRPAQSGAPGARPRARHDRHAGGGDCADGEPDRGRGDVRRRDSRADDRSRLAGGRRRLAVGVRRLHRAPAARRIPERVGDDGVARRRGEPWRSC